MQIYCAQPVVNTDYGILQKFIQYICDIMNIQNSCYDISTLFFFLPLQTKTSNSGIDKDLIFRHEDLAPAAALAAGMKI